MASVREQLLQRFQLTGDVREPDQELGDALYVLLYSIDLKNISVDGWNSFYVIRESRNSLDAVGLMTLLPTGSVPIEINVSSIESGFSWSVQIGRLDSEWLGMSESKQWKQVYLYATGGRDTPHWAWDRRCNGSVDWADA